MLNPNPTIIGTYKGVNKVIIAQSSMKKPRIKILKHMKAIAPYFPPGIAETKSIKMSWQPIALNILTKKFAAIIIQIPITVKVTVVFNDSFNMTHVKRLLATQMISDVTAPNTAASVGEQMPRYIKPSTIKIKRMKGQITIKEFKPLTPR